MMRLAALGLSSLLAGTTLFEGLRAEGSDRGPTPLGKAVAIALREAGHAQVALLPGRLLTGDPKRDEPFVAGTLKGRAILAALASGLAGRERGEYWQTSGLVYEEAGFDPAEVLVGREPIDGEASYRAVLPRAVAESMALEADASPVPSLREARRIADGARPSFADLFPSPSPDFEVERETLSTGGRISVERVSFPTAIPSSRPENDRVPVRLFRPERGNGAAVLILPIWLESKPVLEEGIARRLASLGFLAAILPLAYQFERAPPGVPSGRWTVSADLERTRSALLQSVADARRGLDLLLREGARPGKVAILGVSLGGHVASAVYSLDERFGAGAFVLAGGGVADAIWEASRETRGIRAALQSSGLTREKLAETLLPLDPATHASPARREGAILVGALADRVIPPANVERLWSAYGEPSIVWIPADHYSGVIFLPEIVDRIAAHFRRAMRLAPP